MIFKSISSSGFPENTFGKTAFWLEINFILVNLFLKKFYRFLYHIGKERYLLFLQVENADITEGE